MNVDNSYRAKALRVSTAIVGFGLYTIGICVYIFRDTFNKDISWQLLAGLLLVSSGVLLYFGHKNDYFMSYGKIVKRIKYKGLPEAILVLTGIVLVIIGLISY